MQACIITYINPSLHYHRVLLLFFSSIMPSHPKPPIEWKANNLQIQAKRGGWHTQKGTRRKREEEEEERERLPLPDLPTYELKDDLGEEEGPHAQAQEPRLAPCACHGLHPLCQELVTLPLYQLGCCIQQYWEPVEELSHL